MTRNLDEKYDSQEIAVHGARLNEHERRIATSEQQSQATLMVLSEIRGTLATIATSLAVGNLRMDQIDKHLQHTDGRVDRLEEESDTALRVASKRDPLTFWTTMGTATTVIAGVLTWAFTGKPPHIGGP